MKIRCLDCGAGWDLDMEPSACNCDDGGRWQIWDPDERVWEPEEGARR